MTNAEVIMAVAIDWLSRCAKEEPLSRDEREEIERVVLAIRRTINGTAPDDIERAIARALRWHPSCAGPSYEDAHRECLAILQFPMPPSGMR